MLVVEITDYSSMLVDEKSSKNISTVVAYNFCLICLIHFFKSPCLKLQASFICVYKQYSHKHINCLDILSVYSFKDISINSNITVPVLCFDIHIRI